MSDLVSNILSREQPLVIKESFNSLIKDIFESKLKEMKMNLIAKDYVPVDREVEIDEQSEKKKVTIKTGDQKSLSGLTATGIVQRDKVDEANILNPNKGKSKIIRIRIRSDRVQRNIKRAAAKGYKYEAGKLTRYSQDEKLNRILGQRKAKLKRRAQLSQILQKRKKSLTKRAALRVGHT